MEQLVAQRVIVEREKSPGTQPGALERDQIDIEIAALGERSALRLREAREALVFLRAGGATGEPILSAACGDAARRRA